MIPTNDSASLSRKRVYIVDDHPMVREHLAQLIEQQADMQVCGEAVDLAEALEGLGVMQPDVAIVDISLRSSNGLELIKEVRARGWAIPILVLSMHEDSLYAERVLRAGALGYINKQESSRNILSAIRRVIEGQPYVSSEISERLVRRAIMGTADIEVSPVNQLGDRELEVFQLIGRGLATRQIAEHLGLGVKTVETYRARIKQKLSIDDGGKLLRYAMQWVHDYDSRPSE